MKCASRKVEWSSVCERTAAKPQPKMHGRTSRSRLLFRLRFEIVSRASIENREDYVCDYPSQSPREVVARTTAYRRLVRPGDFWSFGRSDQAKANPGPLQPGMCGLHEPSVRSSRDWPHADEYRRISQEDRGGSRQV